MIPITFNKDDINNLKKGNIRGQDLASLVSIAMPKTAGILDIWSDPVSVTNNTPGTGYATLTMSKGYIVVYGRLIYVEQGEQVQVPLPSSGTFYGVFGIRINLGQTGANEVTWFTKARSLQQDDLLREEINGIYEFGIYNYTATSSGITIGTKIAPVINKMIDEVDNVKQELLQEIDNVKNNPREANALGDFFVVDSQNYQLAGYLSYAFLAIELYSTDHDFSWASQIIPVQNIIDKQEGGITPIYRLKFSDIAITLEFISSSTVRVKLPYAMPTTKIKIEGIK